ncbi:hypothetical protein Hsar01_02144 [Haloferula sargassicola]|uniref:Fibronectin type-III domain-containing protein n=1 Tax=Haloferula sargassicola TaxID=490096 RepID=A0ABP9UMW5_9BACT
MALIDFDKDGLTDIVAAARSVDGIVLLQNTSTPGSLSFTRLTDLPAGDDPLNIAVGDFNEDLWPDLAVSNYGTNSSTGRSITLLLNDQAGGFTPTTLEQGNLRPYGLATADFNKDHHLDLVAGDIENGDRIAVLLGNGDGTFGAIASYPYPDGWDASEILPGDFDQDGNLDFAVTRANYDSTVLAIYPGVGDGTFGERVDLDIGSGYYIWHGITGDFTGDGWPDLVLGSLRTTFFLQNRADGTFGFHVSRLYGDNSYTYGATLGDFNGDGTPDILVTDENDSLLRLLAGNGTHPLAGDDTNPVTGLTHGYGRGYLSDGNDTDNFKFTARAGQLVSLSSDTRALSGTTRLRYLLYDALGNLLIDVQGGDVNNGQATIPRDGTYYVRVQPWNGDYNTEYRFRLTLGPVGAGQMESETNDQISQADGLTLALSGNQRSGRIYGLIDTDDSSGDWFSLGNLSAGTEVRVRLDLPSTTTLGSYTLNLRRSNNTVVATSSDAELVHTIPAGEDDAYYVQLSATGRGMMAEYFANVSITDLIPPSIVGDTLPDPDSTGLIQTFALTFNKDMSAATVTNPANYSLVWNGPDQTPATGDDVSMPIQPSSYSSGLTASYTIIGSPLQPGGYQFRVNGLKDVFGNLIPVPYERSFTILGPGGYQTEQENNNNGASATLLVLNEDLVGYRTTNARGILTGSDNSDYWAFDAVAGEQLVLESYLPGNGNRIRHLLYDPDGGLILDANPNNGDLEGRAPMVLSKTGRYVLHVTDWNSIRSEYRFRVSLIGDAIDYESEPNGSLPEADPLTFTQANGIDGATVGGFVSTPTQLDYFNLGNIPAGTTVFLSVRKPQGSTLVPIVGIYDEGGFLKAEVGGNNDDDHSEVQITTTGTYYALMRANIGSSGINGDYLLDVRSLPTGNINFPNLRVTRLDDLAATGLRTGDTATVSYDVTNGGNLSTGVANWVDRIVLSGNNVYGDGDDLQLAVVPHAGALDPGGSYTVNQPVTLPDGYPGDFHIIVATDSANAVDEILQEGDNTLATANPFNVQLQDYPDLVIEDLAISAPDAFGNYDISWNLANRGTGSAPAGHTVNLRVLNTTGSQVIFDQDIAVAQVLNAGETLAQSQVVTANNPGFHLVTVVADADLDLYEYGTNGHGPAEQNSVQDSFQIFNFFDITVAASPAAGGSVGGGGNFRDGVEATVTATPNTSVLPYRFINWTENGQFASASPTYTFTVHADRNLVAVFGLPQYQITASPTPAAGGSIAGTGTYELNATATLTANPAPGYLFDYWEEGGLNIGSANPLSFSVNSGRSFIAHFAEANPQHVVSIVTSPPGLVSIPGGGTYDNGQTLNITAPASIEDGDTEHLFEKFLLNGVHLNTSPTLTKTFSTLDPATMTYTAVYKDRSLRPVLASVSTNYGNLVPAVPDVRFTLTFDRDMNPAVMPVLSLTSSTAATIPTVPSGSWTNARTYVSGNTDFSGDSAGAFTLNVSAATDAQGRVMEADASFGFTVDALPPENPTLVLDGTTSSTATISWNGYTAPADLNGFRYYLETAPFTTVNGLVAVNGAGAAARSYTFRNLMPDVDYHVAVVALDFAGNANPEVTPLTFRLDTELPPAVSPILERPGIASARLDWSSYDRDLIGLEGFRIYVSESDFSSVSGMTPEVDLAADVTEYLFEGLDRTRDYYFAVVAYNRNDEQTDAVSPVMWSDPLSGTLTEDFSIGGADSVIPIYESLVLSGGANLTLAPGTTLTFAPGTSLTVETGTLTAEGTALLPIHFTSEGEFADPPTAARGDWAGLILNDGSSSLSHVWVRFGSGLQVGNGSPTLSNIYAVQNSGAGLLVSGTGDVTATSCYLVYNQTGASTTDTGQLDLSQSVLKSNSSGNASQAGGSTFVAQNNWWGNTSPSGISGTVDSSSPLAQEPILGAAFQVKGGLAQTPSRPITLFIQSANGIGYRFSENSAFPVAIFEDLFAADDDFRVSPYGFELPFTLSPGAGLKTVYAQLRSETDTASSTLSTSISLVTDGPVIQTFSLADGAVIGRPLRVTATASAPRGLTSIEFLVGGSVVARSTNSPLDFLWDPRSLPQGPVRVEAKATDRYGATSSRAVNIVVSPGPPVAPVITSPVNGAITNASPVTVTGTAEPGISLTLKRNGEVITNSATAALNGSFSIPNVPLVEGANSLVVTASDFVGSSASQPVSLIYDSGPPAAPVLDTIERANGGVLVNWIFQGGEQPASYRLYWNATAFTNPDNATGSSAPVTTTGGNFTLPDGIWFVGVAAFDGAGNRSPISNLIQFGIDYTAPTLTVSYDRPMPVGPGNLLVQVESNEPLANVPTLTIQPAGGLDRISVTLTQQESTRYTGTYVVDPQFSRSGTATVRVSARDLAGNVRTNVAPQGPALVLDVTKPTAVVSLDRPVPVQTVSPQTLSVGLTLSEPPAPGTTPSLEFEPPVGSRMAITLDGAGTAWSGQLTVNAAMGNGDGFFRFAGSDAAGNQGTVVTSGEVLELYNTSAPPPPEDPPVISGVILSGGRIRIDWQAVDRADSYKLYREAGSAGGTPTLLVESGIEALTYTDLPPADGIYRYAVVASLRGSDGPASGVLVAESDRVPPEKATAFSVQLLARGVEISFAAPASGEIPAKYRVYRGATMIRELSSPAMVTDYPPRGSHDYTVATVDQYGNENPTDPITVELLVSPVADLHLHAKKGSANSLTWTSNDGTVVGYNIYRNGVKQNGAPLAPAAFVDPLGLAGRPVTYEVSAVNGAGNESPRRQLTVYPLDLAGYLNRDSLGRESASFIGFFDKLQLDVRNLASTGAVAIEGMEINRTVTGEDDMTQDNALALNIAPGATGSTEVVIPAPLTAGVSQTFQVILEGATDSGGSRVTYEFQFAKSVARGGANAAALSTTDIPVAGGYASVQVTLQNFGGATMDVVLGRAGGLQPGDVAIVVRDANGEIVSRQAYTGIGAQGLLTFPDGTLVARIPAGGTYTFVVPNVLVPESLGEQGLGATFAIEVGGLYSGFGSSTSVSQTPLIQGSTFSSLVETPYYANLVTDQDRYANEEDIVITGQAINRQSGLPEPNVPLRIGFGIRSYVLYQEVTTDENGDYTFSYRPPQGFGGAIRLWAAHPDVADQLNQKTIEYRRFYIVPGGGRVVMSKNDTLDLSLKLVNPADLPLSDIHISSRSYISEDSSEVEIDSLHYEVLTPGPINLEPFGSTTIDIRATADIDAPDSAISEIYMTSAENASATFEAHLSLKPAIPALSFVSPAVGYVDMSVNKGEIVSREVVLTNDGLRPLEGVEVIPPANLPWMDVNLPRDSQDRILLPDIPVGGTLRFTVVYAPPQDTALGLYDDFMLIRGSNLQSDFQVNLFAQVTSAERGGVMFYVDNIFAEAVPNAKIRLRNPNLRQEIGPFYTDSLGEVTIPDLQEGSWSYQISASGHTTTTGVFDITPGQTELVDVRLSKSLVTVEFSVTPKPFTDRYEITIEQTFETRVPVPVLIMDPPATQLYNIQDYAEGTIMINVKNEGLASLFEVVIQGQTAPYGSFIPMISYIPELHAQESIQVPFKYTFDLRNRNGGSGASPSGYGCPGLDGLAKAYEVAAEIDKNTSLPSTGNEGIDFCAGVFLNPFPSATGLVALSSGLACCPDGAAMAAGAHALLVGYSAASFATGIVTNLQAFVGCAIGAQFGGLFGGSGGGATGGGGPARGTGTFNGSGAGCFVSGTLVEMAQGPPKPIEAILSGDLIKTGDDANAVVEQMLTRESDDVYEVTLRPVVFGDAENEKTLTGTGNHYIWTDHAGWLRLDKLKPGDRLHYTGGELYEITGIEHLPGTHTVHTLQVAVDGVFYADGFLVQHLCGRLENDMQPGPAPPAETETAAETR